MTDYQKIRNAIENCLIRGGRQFLIFPFGEYGMLTKKILNECFGIQEEYIVDNKLSEYNKSIKSLDFFQDKDTSDYTILLTSANLDVYEEVRRDAGSVFDRKRVIDIFRPDDRQDAVSQKPECGKYSYGALCNSELVESIGAFSSLAYSAAAVVNHPVNLLSTHPFLYWDVPDTDGYFPGVMHKKEVRTVKKSKIGNDVWIGHNVTITNGANIGNGVIVAAGSVITKDIPDYAVVAGAPAKILRYRYTLEQISELNKIAWWDWTDEKIRECYNDFFENIDVFISKHRKD